MYFFFFFYFRFVIDNAKLTWRVEEKHLQLHFVIVEVTQNILFYELDVLYIFDTNKDCLVRSTNLFDFWFDKRQRYVKRMETILEYLLDSGTILNMLEIQKH